MNNSEWVDIKMLADALGFKTETLRRGCASEKYVCRFKKSGKYKNYEIAISSLPSAYLKKYNKYLLSTYYVPGTGKQVLPLTSFNP